MPPEIDLKSYFQDLLAAVKDQIQELKSSDQAERKEFMNAIATLESRIGKIELSNTQLYGKVESLQGSIHELEKYKAMVDKLATNVDHIFKSIDEIKKQITDSINSIKNDLAEKINDAIEPIRKIIEKNKSMKATIFIGICTPLVTAALFYIVQLLTAKH